jgi:hypothetical protein
VELLDEYYAPDGSDPGMGDLQAMKDAILWYHRIAPGIKITIVNMVAEGDCVAVDLQVDLTYSVAQDPAPDYPFGKPVRWTIMNFWRIVDGKCVALHSANLHMVSWLPVIARSIVDALDHPRVASDTHAARWYAYV